MQKRNIDITRYRSALSEGELADRIRTATPTTRWWIEEISRRVGLKVEPDFSTTFIASQSVAGTAGYSPTKRDAYRVFHELVPATDFGRGPPTRLSANQRSFLRRILPSLIEVSRSMGDTDAVAEALVSAALMNLRDTPAYRDGLAWLLARQHPDGTYVSARDKGGTWTSDHYRHVVLVASWAVLTSLSPDDRSENSQSREAPPHHRPPPKGEREIN